MKTVRLSALDDYPDWMRLAKEVEPLFGPMIEDPAFHEGLKKAISEGNAFCASEDGPRDERSGLFHGGIVISKTANEIVWLAVAQKSRRRGIGTALLSEAIDNLDGTRPITVTTFDQTVQAGIPARSLYQSAGFRDSGEAGPNPAGIPTVTMALIKYND